MICLLLNIHDKGGTWLYRALKNRGVENLVLISAEELLYAPRFNCGINESGPWFDITLQSGLELTQINMHRVLNRIAFLPNNQVSHFVPDDQAYVNQEQLATFTFLFRILPNQLFNSASGRGLSGSFRPQMEWLALAHNSGLTTIETGFEFFRLHQNPPDPASLRETVLFFNGKCIGPSPLIEAQVYERCEQLAKLAQERIIEFHFHRHQGALYFSGADTTPSFAAHQEAFINELIPLL